MNLMAAKRSSTLLVFTFILVTASCVFLVPTPVSAQELIVNGAFSNGLTNWTTSSWAGGSSFGVNANGPTDTSAASGNYAYAGGGTYNLLQQSISGVTNGGNYRLTFQVGSKSGEASTYGLVSLFDGLAGNYNSASFDYRPSSAAFGTYTVDFTARGATDLWLRNDGGGYAAYDNVSVTQIGSVANALSYSSASGYTEITSALSGSGKVTVNAGSGGLTLKGANTYSGGTEVTGGTLFVTDSGTLGAASGAVTANGGILDLRNQQTRTGTISITNTGFILSGTGTGSLVNNGGAFEFGGGSLEVSLSGSGGMNVTGGGRITSSNSYTGATTISGTSGWFGTHTFHLVNANALGAASGDLTVSGGTVDLQNNTITRSGNLTISGGTINSGTISKAGSNYDIQGGVINAALAGTAGLTKSGAGNSALYGANTYSGDTVINQGTLVVGSAGGLGNAAGAVTVNSGAGLYVGGGLTIARTGNFTVNGGTLSSDNANLGTISLSGGNFVANNGAALAVKLAGTGGLTVGGMGDTYLWAANSYSGPTVINSGQLVLGGSGAIAETSAVQIASGAAMNLTGAWAPNDINRTIGGLTGAGILWGGGGTVTVNKASGTDTFTGDIQGGHGLIKSGAGDLVLGGASSYTGTTTVNAGRLVVAHGNALGGTAGGTTVANGAQLMLTNVTVGNEALTLNGAGLASGSLTAGALRSIGTNTYQGKITLGSDARIFGGSGTSLTLDVASGEAVDLASHTLTIDGAGASRINDAIVGTGGLTKSGSGRNTLAAANSYSGATAVNAGTLEVASGGSISSSATTVNSGGTLDVAGTAGNVTVNNGGTLKGSGTVSALSIASGGTLAPGNSTGILNTGSTTFLGGGNYDWEIDTFGGGVVGTNWDFLNITGDLTISASSGSQFIIDVISLLSSTDTAGLASNFNDGTNYTFAIATASGTISGYAANAFSINTTAFQNAFTGTWGTSLSNDGKSLNLTYTAATAIPEPSSVSLMVLGLATVLAKRRRKS